MKDNFYVVAIGTSAGGMPVLQRILSRLPGHINAAFVIIQHLHPDFRSISSELLSSFTTMPVYRVYEGQRLEAGSVYVLPENQMMTVRHGVLSLMERRPEQTINSTIDIFFDSLGKDYGDKAIGIVLTGRGNDGMAGSNTLHNYGGIVMVQAPATAEYENMPQATIEGDHPDYVLPVNELVSQLIRLITAQDK